MSSPVFTPLLAPPAVDPAGLPGTADATVAAVTPLDTPELRSGVWTRLGDDAVLGDAATESALSYLAESTRSAARSQGYAVGWSEGRRMATAQAQAAAAERDRLLAADRDRHEREHREVVQALTRVTADLRRAADEVRRQVSAQAVELARELTEAMFGHELRAGVDGDPADDVIARVLACAPDDVPVSVRLHPRVAAGPAAGVLADGQVRVVPDDRLDPADALVEVEGAIIDLRLREALARVRQALS